MPTDCACEAGRGEAVGRSQNLGEFSLMSQKRLRRLRAGPAGRFVHTRIRLLPDVGRLVPMRPDTRNEAHENDLVAQDSRLNQVSSDSPMQVHYMV